MYVLISTLNAKLLGYKHIKELYADDHDFSVEYQACEKTTVLTYSLLILMITNMIKFDKSFEDSTYFFIYF